MNGFWGADTEALRSAGSLYARRADLLSDLEALLSSTIDGVEWVGEDAEAFRADWSGSVRPDLQDRSVELRMEARRLMGHADEQEHASSPDGPAGSLSTPDAFLRDLAQRAHGILQGLGGDGGSVGPADDELGEQLNALLSTPEGRDAFLGALLGSAFGGLLAEIIGRAAALGMALQDALAALSPAAGLGALLGEAPLAEGGAGGAGSPASEAASEGAGSGGAGAGSEGSASGGSGSSEGAGADGGTDSSESSGGTAGSTAGSGSDGGAGSGSGGGSGSEGGSGSGADGGPAGADTADGGATDGTAGAAGGAQAMTGQVDGAALSGGAVLDGPAGGVDDGGSLLERLLEMIADLLAPGDADAASVGHDIGHATTGAGRS